MRAFKRPFDRQFLGGRKLQMTPEKIELARKLIGEGKSHEDVARRLGVSVPTVYRHLPAAQFYESSGERLKGS